MTTTDPDTMTLDECREGRWEAMRLRPHHGHFALTVIIALAIAFLSYEVGKQTATNAVATGQATIEWRDRGDGMSSPRLVWKETPR